MEFNVVSFGFNAVSLGSRPGVYVRCLPNPFYVRELKEKTGLDQEVVDYVMKSKRRRSCCDADFLEFCELPLYVKGKPADDRH